MTVNTCFSCMNTLYSWLLYELQGGILFKALNSLLTPTIKYYCINHQSLQKYLVAICTSKNL